MKMSVAGKVAAAIGILAVGLTGFQAPAFAGSGRLNIQTVPEGARYLIVTRKDLRVVQEGVSPYFDLGFPVGNYMVCFELAGYETAWQDSSVSTYGSSWVGPVMKNSGDAGSITCEEDLARITMERNRYRSELLETIKTAERNPPPHPLPQEAVAPETPAPISHADDVHYEDRDRSRPRRGGEIRDNLGERRRQ